ncbi:hypothetical protein LguiB_020523 [Lonicera macranthoides]
MTINYHSVVLVCLVGHVVAPNAAEGRGLQRTFFLGYLSSEVFFCIHDLEMNPCAKGYGCLQLKLPMTPTSSGLIHGDMLFSA